MFDLLWKVIVGARWPSLVGPCAASEHVASEVVLLEPMQC